MKKYQIEKVFHEIMRDIPEAAKCEELWKKGFITLNEMIDQIIKIYYESIKKRV